LARSASRRTTGDGSHLAGGEPGPLPIDSATNRTANTLTSPSRPCRGRHQEGTHQESNTPSVTAQPNPPPAIRREDPAWLVTAWCTAMKNKSYAKPSTMSTWNAKTAGPSCSAGKRRSCACATSTSNRLSTLTKITGNRCDAHLHNGALAPVPQMQARRLGRGGCPGSFLDQLGDLGGLGDQHRVRCPDLEDV